MIPKDMKQTLKPVIASVQLLREVVATRCPNLLKRIDETKVNELSREERRNNSQCFG